MLRFYIKKLTEYYNYLKRSLLVKKKIVNRETLTYFERILNKAQTGEPELLIVRKFVWDMFKNNKKKWISYINNDQYRGFILWTDGRSITKHFKINNIVRIKWNRGVFSIVKYSPTYREEKTDENLLLDEDVEKTDENLLLDEDVEKIFGIYNISNNYKFERW